MLFCTHPWPELHQTRFLGLLQAISKELGVGSGKIPVLADYPNFAPWSNFWHFFGRLQDDAVLHLPLDRIAQNSFSWAFAGHFTGIGYWKPKNTSISRLPQFCSLEQLLAFFRPAPRRCCPALTSGPNSTKLGFLCFCMPFHLNRALETGRHHYQQIGTVLAFFWRFFGCLKEDAFLHSPLARIAPNSVSWAFAGHFNGIGCWKRKNTSISRLPQFCSLEQLLAFFRPAPRRCCPALTSGPNSTKIGFL